MQNRFMVNDNTSINVTKMRLNKVSIAFTVITFLFIIDLSLALGDGGGIGCGVYQTMEVCAKNYRQCLWSYATKSKEARCMSVLPCALESSENDCAMNTWGCDWNADVSRCKTRTQPPNLTQSTKKCVVYKAQANCEFQRYCYWGDDNVCKRRPNIFISLPEGLGWYDVEWTNKRARSPVLNRMRERGVILDRHYSTRQNSASRGSLLTGVNNWRMGLQTDENLMPLAAIRCAVPVNETGMLPYALKTAGGYTTHAFGKYCLGMYRDDTLPQKRGFDTFIGFIGPNIISSDGNTQYYGYRCACKTGGDDQGQCDNHLVSKKKCFYFRDMMNATSTDTIFKTVSRDAIIDNRGIPKYDHTDMFLADQIASQIYVSSSQPQPFFIHAGWVSPHDPQDVPDRLMQPIWEITRKSGLDNNQDLSTICQAGPLASARVMNLGIVGLLDDAHRVVIDALDQVDELDSTIFIFLTTSGKLFKDAHLSD
jgi:hypothetical protein